MVSPVLDILLFLSSYLTLFILRKSVEKAGVHPPVLRVVGFTAGSVLILSVFDWVFNFIFITYQAVTENVYLFYTLFSMLLVIVVALRAMLHPLESFEIDEVKDFLRESLLFNNYLRRKDVEFREEYNSYIVRKTHRETSNRPIEEILPQHQEKKENRFDDITPESIERVQREKLTKKIRAATEGLRKGETLDASDPFRIELMANTDHPYMVLLNEFIIDPRKKIFTIRLPLPDTFQIDAGDEKQLNELIGDLYVMVQMLYSQSWLQPFTPFFKTITLNTLQSIWDDLGTVSVRQLLTISLSISDLHRYQGNIMPPDSVKRIASITVHRTNAGSQK